MSHGEGFGKVLRSLWGSRKFRQLRTDEARLLFVYLLAASGGNGLGCFPLRPEQACLDLGPQWDAGLFDAAMADLEKVGLVQYNRDFEWVLVLGYMRRVSVPMNAKHAKGMARKISVVSVMPFREILVNEFNAFHETFDTVLQALPNGLHIVSVRSPKPMDRVSKRSHTSMKPVRYTETETETETETSNPERVLTSERGVTSSEPFAARAREARAPLAALAGAALATPSPPGASGDKVGRRFTMPDRGGFASDAELQAAMAAIPDAEPGPKPVRDVVETMAERMRSLGGEALPETGGVSPERTREDDDAEDDELPDEPPATRFFQRGG